MEIFHSYVSLPEGTVNNSQGVSFEDGAAWRSMAQLGKELRASPCLGEYSNSWLEQRGHGGASWEHHG